MEGRSEGNGVRFKGNESRYGVLQTRSGVINTRSSGHDGISNGRNARSGGNKDKSFIVEENLDEIDVGEEVLEEDLENSPILKRADVEDEDEKLEVGEPGKEEGGDAVEIGDGKRGGGRRVKVAIMGRSKINLVMPGLLFLEM
ncbi:hypothetical protein Syun_009776 [Stephania yunnanensis]|uniref:Uncharacterized protein n=1 Tax=Stephania yunnanensis TaxID=152371 RepID=A0AAP0KF98_9MAGN